MTWYCALFHSLIGQYRYTADMTLLWTALFWPSQSLRTSVSQLVRSRISTMPHCAGLQRVTSAACPGLFSEIMTREFIHNNLGGNFLDFLSQKVRNWRLKIGNIKNHNYSWLHVSQLSAVLCCSESLVCKCSADLAPGPALLLSSSGSLAHYRF